MFILLVVFSANVGAYNWPVISDSICRYQQRISPKDSAVSSLYRWLREDGLLAQNMDNMSNAGDTVFFLDRFLAINEYGYPAGWVKSKRKSTHFSLYKDVTESGLFYTRIVWGTKNSDYQMEKFCDRWDLKGIREAEQKYPSKIEGKWILTRIILRSDSKFDIKCFEFKMFQIPMKWILK